MENEKNTEIYDLYQAGMNYNKRAFEEFSASRAALVPNENL